MIEQQHLPFGLLGFFVFVVALGGGVFWIKEMNSADFALEWLP